jgi:hypothetical protein
MRLVAQGLIHSAGATELLRVVILGIVAAERRQFSSKELCDHLPQILGVEFPTNRRPVVLSSYLKALLRLYCGAIKALLRLYCGAIKALFLKTYIIYESLSMP